MGNSAFQCCCQDRSRENTRDGAWCFTGCFIIPHCETHHQFSCFCKAKKKRITKVIKKMKQFMVPLIFFLIFVCWSYFLEFFRFLMSPILDFLFCIFFRPLPFFLIKQLLSFFLILTLPSSSILDMLITFISDFSHYHLTIIFFIHFFSFRPKVLNISIIYFIVFRLFWSFLLILYLFSINLWCLVLFFFMCPVHSGRRRS